MLAKPNLFFFVSVIVLLLLCSKIQKIPNSVSFQHKQKASFVCMQLPNIKTCGPMYPFFFPTTNFGMSQELPN